MINFTILQQFVLYNRIDGGVHINFKIRILHILVDVETKKPADLSTGGVSSSEATLEFSSVYCFIQHKVSSLPHVEQNCLNVNLLPHTIID